MINLIPFPQHAFAQSFFTKTFTFFYRHQVSLFNQYQIKKKSKNMKKVVFYLTPDYEFKTADLSMVVEHTAQDFVDEFYPECDHLIIRTNETQFIPPNSQKIVQMHPELIQDMRGRNNNFPKVYIFAEKDQLSFREFVRIHPILSEKGNNYTQGKIFPAFFYSVNSQKLDISTSEFLQQIPKSLEFENKPKRYIINNNLINENMPFSEFLNLAETSTIKYEFELTNSGNNYIAQRENIIKELIKTEETYLSDLDSIVDFWEPNLRNTDYFTNEEFDMMFSDIPSIIQVHTDFLMALKRNNQGFGTFLSPIWFKFADQFTVAKQQISQFPLITQMIEEKMNDIKGFSEYMKSLQNLHAGKDFLSVMVAPVQRLPRYQLFLRELIKKTPKFHSDYGFIEKSKKLVEDVSRNIDIESKRIIQGIQVKKLSITIKDYELKDPKRKVILMRHVHINSESSGKTGYFVVFNDKIVVIRQHTKESHVLYDSPVHCFHYLRGDDRRSLSVAAIKEGSLFGNQKVKYTVIFANEADMKQTLDEIKHLQTEHITSFGSNNIINWSCALDFHLPSLMKASVDFYDRGFYIFGGKTGQPKQMISNSLLFVSRIGKVKKIGSVNSGRYGHTLTTYDGKLYIIGGRSQDLMFKRILCFDIEKKAWIQASTNDETKFGTRYGHSTVVYNNKLFIFGGKNSANQLLNNIIVYDPKGDSFTIPETQNAPPPRMYHAACVLGNRMFIYGGKSGKGILDDLWELNLDTLKWMKKTTIGDKITPKIGAKMVLIDSTVLLIGGQSTTPESPSYAISIDNMEVRTLHDCGNFPQSINGFAGIADPISNTIYVFGGREPLFSRISKEVYRVTLNASLLLQIKSKHAVNNQIPLKFNLPNRSSLGSVGLPLSLSEGRALSQDVIRGLKRLKKIHNRSPPPVQPPKIHFDVQPSAPHSPPYKSSQQFKTTISPFKNMGKVSTFILEDEDGEEIEGSDSEEKSISMSVSYIKAKDTKRFSLKDYNLEVQMGSSDEEDSSETVCPFPQLLSDIRDGFPTMKMSFPRQSIISEPQIAPRMSTPTILQTPPDVANVLISAPMPRRKSTSSTVQRKRNITVTRDPKKDEEDMESIIGLFSNDREEEQRRKLAAERRAILLKKRKIQT